MSITRITEIVRRQAQAQIEKVQGAAQKSWETECSALSGEERPIEE